jgi:hypothetical protein
MSAQWGALASRRTGSMVVPGRISVPAMNEQIRLACDSLKGRALPYDLGQLQFLTGLPWDEIREEDTDNCAEILLRVTATAIEAAFISDINMRESYRSTLSSFATKMCGVADLLHSEDFLHYLNKFRSRLADI